MLRTSIWLCAAGLLLACDRDNREAPAGAWEDDKQNEKPAAPDNTAVNQRDQNSEAKTPFDQGNGAYDLRVTQQIRQAIIGHDGLGFTAKNIKVITEAGRVTLRGPVANASERSVVEKIAIDAAGAGRVDNQLEVEADNANNADAPNEVNKPNKPNKPNNTGEEL